MEERIKKTIEQLKRNQFEVHYFERRQDVFDYLNRTIQDQQMVSCGGSTTLFQLGIIDYLREREIEFLDRYQEGLGRIGLEHLFRQSFFCDYYLTSSNAITEAGELYNIDGRGNRVAAMIYGPKHVIVIAGVNKIVKDLEEAEVRTKEIACVKNTKRLNLNTPCTRSNNCVDCDHEERICNDYVVIKRSPKGRIKVILVNEELGF